MCYAIFNLLSVKMPIDRLSRFTMALAVSAIGITLLGYGYVGLFMRYSGDEYCYGSVLTQHGFFGGQVYAYLNRVPFSGNRYSLTLFSLFFSLFPPSISGLLPVSVILLWFFGLMWVLRRIAFHVRINIPSLGLWLIAGYLVFIALYTAPDLSESLYWRSAMLPYLAPMVTNIFLIAILLTDKAVSRLAVVGLFVLALLSGGFSEVAAAIQIMYLAGWLFVRWWNIKDAPIANLRSSKLISAAFIGSLLSLGMLFFSPSIQTEVSMSTAFAELGRKILMTLDFAMDFLIDTVQSLPLPILITFTFFALLSATISAKASPATTNGRKLAALLLSAVVFCYLLVAAGIAPSVFARDVYPNPRALIGPRFILLLLVAFAGWTIGRYLELNLRRSTSVAPIIPWISALFLIAVAVYSLRGGYQIIPRASRYAAWASAWDERDAQIRAALENGAQDLEVIQIEKIFQWVAELGPDPGAWYNQCAAAFYGARSIEASLPVSSGQ